MQYRLFILFFTFSTLSIKAQVTIGAAIAPQKFSVLQLESDSGGLRLSNLNTAQRNALAVSSNNNAKGLVIYNTDRNSMEMWNGLKWVSSSQLSAANGVVLTNDSIKLGGSLQNNTTIDMGANNLNFLASKGSIGIGTNNPKAKLDVEGNIRLGSVTTMSSDISILVRNNTTGVVGTAQNITLTIAAVAPGATGTATITPGFITADSGFVTVSSTNSCSKRMSAIFNVLFSNQEFGAPIFYMNSIARNVVGQATRINSYIYQVLFPAVTICSGGDATQFNFTINTSAPGTISITNNGNVARTYTIKVSQNL